MTAHVLQITNGSTTITLSDSNPVSIRGAYVPMPSMGGENVTETFEIYIRPYSDGSGNSSAVLALQKLQDINKILLEGARWNQFHVGRQAWIYLDPNDAGNDRRAHIISGVCEATDTTFTRMTDGHVIATITWTRSIYEAKTLAQIRQAANISNSNGGTAINYVEIAGTLLAGDFYAPTKILYRNLSGTVITNVWIGEANETLTGFTFGANDNHLHIEAEAAAETPGGSAVADSGSSGGTCVTYSWTSASETFLAGWDIAGTVIDYYGGGKYGILARLAGTASPSDLYVRYKFGSKVDAGGGTTLYKADWSGNLVKVPQYKEMFLVDTINLPPVMPQGNASGTVAGKSLWLWGFKGDGSVVTFNLDYFGLIPIAPESELNYFTTNGAGIGTQEYLVHDTINESTYRAGTALTDLSSEFIQEQGRGIFLTPGQNTRIYFHAQGLGVNSSGTVDPLRTGEVQVWYSPRYRTV